MTLQENKDLVRRFVEVVQNEHNLGALDEFYSADFVDYGGMANPSNREGARALLGAFISAFSDFHFAIHQQLAEGDRVMTFKTCQGTHLGPIAGFAATGRPVTFNVIDIFSVTNGQISGHWLVTNLHDVLLQITAGSDH